MRQFFITFSIGLFCLVAGLLAGMLFSPQLKMMPPMLWLNSIASPTPDKDSPYEMYNYPTIKWKPKPLADVQGALVQLWTTYEKPDPQQPGKMNYRLTVFKAPNKQRCEIQLLDENSFKLMQFEASDFHQIPGTADIMEARESQPCTEEEYRRVKEYSIK